MCRPSDRRSVLPGRSTAVLAGVHVVAPSHRAAVSAGLVIARPAEPAGGSRGVPLPHDKNRPVPRGRRPHLDTEPHRAYALRQGVADTPAVGSSDPECTTIAHAGQNQPQVKLILSNETVSVPFAFRVK
jgi:hypothetical protein